MLVPATVFAEEVSRKFRMIAYTERMFWFSGNQDYFVPNLSDEQEPGEYRYVCVSKDCTQIYGYLTFHINFETRTLDKISCIRFTDDGRITFNRDVLNKVNEAIDSMNLHRVEFWMIGGNPVLPAYQKFVKSKGGREVVLKDVSVDKYGKYHDTHIFEIILKEV